MSATVELQDVPVLDIGLYDIDVPRDPHGCAEALRKSASTVFIEPHGVHTAGRYTEARNVMSKWQRFCHNGVVGTRDFHKHGDLRTPSKLVEIDPPEQAPVRAAVLKAMSPLVVRQFKQYFVKKAACYVNRLFDMCEFNGVEDRTKPRLLYAFTEAVCLATPYEKTLVISGMPLNQRVHKNARYRAGMARAQPDIEGLEEWVKREAVLPGEKCSSITGTALPADGGLTLHRKPESTAEGQLAAVARPRHGVDG